MQTGSSPSHPIAQDPCQLFPAVLISASEGGAGQASPEIEAQELELPRQNISTNEEIRIQDCPRKLSNRLLGLFVVAPFEVACLVILLAFISVIPGIQLISLGYLLEVSGRLGRGEHLRQAFLLRAQAGRIGLALFFLFIFAQPIRLVSYWSVAAELVDPNNPIAGSLRILSAVLVVVTFSYLAWAWARGGRFHHYLWPQPLRFLREGWRIRTWDKAVERLFEMLVSLRLPQLAWLGFRGSIGVLGWILIPATLIIGATRQGETGLAGLIGAVGLILMGTIVAYLPILQAQMASQQRLKSIFHLREARRAFASSPFACWLGTTATLLLAIPLYLLKIEALPKEIAWLPAILFVAFMLPAHAVTGWAWKRSQRIQQRKGFWAFCWRNLWRLMTIPVVFIYLFVLYFSQLTSWDGLATWFQQHAFLVPFPFTGV